MRSGQTDGLRLAQAEVAAATYGRKAFLRQLEPAESCVEAGMHALSYSLLDELGRILDERKLDEWEQKATLQRAWIGLRDSGRAMAALKSACGARAEEAEARLEGHAPSEVEVDGDENVDTEELKNDWSTQGELLSRRHGSELEPCCRLSVRRRI